jgi:molybdenum cofactor cytidylyltransferase
MIPEIWAIILAAGESKRMKVPKMLLPFNGKTMIEMTIMNVINSEVFNTLVVLGSYRDEICGVISSLPVTICINDNYREGMLSSVQCGLRNIPESAGAVLIIPGDQPLIEPAVINRVINAYRSLKKGIVMPVFKGRRGHPLLIDRKYIDEIKSYGNNEVLSSLAGIHKEDVLEVSVNSPEILKDFNTKEDYLIEINKMK